MLSRRLLGGVSLTGRMKRRLVAGVSLTAMLAAVSAVWLFSAREAAAHCQVPCGIYDDSARITRLLEDAATIQKAIGQINALADHHGAQAMNQAARWINTKEAHASHVIEVVAEYFLTQRVKPVAAGAGGHEVYLAKLADHHAVMVAAMKTKQTVDPAAADALRRAIERLGRHYVK